MSASNVTNIRSRQKQDDQTDKTMILLLNGVATFNTEYATMIERIAPNVSGANESLLQEVFEGLQKAQKAAKAYLLLDEEARHKELKVVCNPVT